MFKVYSYTAQQTCMFSPCRYLSQEYQLQLEYVFVVQISYFIWLYLILFVLVFAFFCQFGIYFCQYHVMVGINIHSPHTFSSYILCNSSSFIYLDAIDLILCSVVRCMIPGCFVDVFVRGICFLLPLIICPTKLSQSTLIYTVLSYYSIFVFIILTDLGIHAIYQFFNIFLWSIGQYVL